MKRWFADGSVGLPHVRVGHCQAPLSTLSKFKAAKNLIVYSVRVFCYGLKSKIKKIKIAGVNLDPGIKIMKDRARVIKAKVGRKIFYVRTLD